MRAASPHKHKSSPGSDCGVNKILNAFRRGLGRGSFFCSSALCNLYHSIKPSLFLADSVSRGLGFGGFNGGTNCSTAFTRICQQFLHSIGTLLAPSYHTAPEPSWPDRSVRCADRRPDVPQVVTSCTSAAPCRHHSSSLLTFAGLPSRLCLGSVPRAPGRHRR